MKSLTQKLSDIVGAAFVDAGLDAVYGAVRVADRPDLAQFQCNGAMVAAKKAGKNPREVATSIRDILYKLNPNIAFGSLAEVDANDIYGVIKSETATFGTYVSSKSPFSYIEIAGAGFLNFKITDEYLNEHLNEISKDSRRGVPDLGHGQIVVVDYGGPNIAKAMHVGHLRAAIIGDSVRRIMSFVGYKTLGDVHMGDWGTHMGMLIDDYITKNETALVMNTDLSSQSSIDSLMEDMAERYPRASGAAKENPDIMARALDATVKLQNKEEPYYSIWQKIRDVSVLGMKSNYDLLGVHFDLWKGEADVHDYIPLMVDDLREKHIAVESDGAWIIPVARNDDKKEFPPLILYKRDGAVMYGTTDMATILERVKLYNPDKIIYVVDQRQSLHFEQLYRAARMGGLVRDDVELTHAGFGTMNGTDGKPFKTRAGGVMRLDDLIAMGIDRANARMDEANIAKDMGVDERADIAHKVAIAAIKFADLQNARHADYVFDIDRLTSFEGKTGPYLLYQAVRIKSLLKKADFIAPPLLHLPPMDGGEEGWGGLMFQLEHEKSLALLLTELPESIEAALKNYAPHYIADYAYRLAQGFSSFYGNCHILSESDEALRQSRLTLCHETYKNLELALGLLGIGIPDRM